MLRKTYSAVLSIRVTYDNYLKAEYNVEYSALEDYISGEMLMYGFSTAMVESLDTGEIILQVENTDGVVADELLS